MAVVIQIRRDQSSQWTSVNPVLAEGEIGIELNTEKAKLGNGTSAWTSLAYISTWGGGAASVTSQELSVVAAALSVRVDTVSNAVSVLSQAVSVADAALSARVDSAAQAASVLSQGLSVETAARVAGDDALSQAISVLSQAVSVADAALSVRIDDASAAVTGEVAARAAASATLNARITSVNAFLSGISARSVGDVSVHGIQSVIDALSNRISAGGGGGGSVTSQELSVVAAALSARVDTVSNAVSVLSQAVSVADAALSLRIDGAASFQTRTRNGSVLVISAATLSDIPDMSLALSAGGLYDIRGFLAYECGTSGGFAFGMSLPALLAQGTFIVIEAAATIVQAAGGAATTYAIGRVALSAVAAGQTVITSVSVATINSLRGLMINGMVAVSANGTLQLMAKTSVAGASMSVRGGFIQSRRVN